MDVHNSKSNDTKNETVENKESCGRDEKASELLSFKKICHPRCSICNSGVLKEVHDMRKIGTHFDGIIDKIFCDHKIKLSISSLSRHFKAYRTFKAELSTEIIKNDVIAEVTLQAVHIKKTVELLDLAYDQLLTKFKAKNYNIDISDLEKLTKIRYSILNGDNVDDNQLMAIFQKASNDYGLNIEQGVLFKS